MKRRRYEKPVISKVKLEPEQAVLGCCSFQIGGKLQGTLCFYFGACTGSNDLSTPS